MAQSMVSSSLVPALYHVNVPTRDQATVAVAQVRDALDSMYFTSQSLRDMATSSDHVNNPAIVAYKLMTESKETQEVVAQVVSDPNVFSAIWTKVREIPVFRNIVETVKRIKEGATNCLIPRDRKDLAEYEEIAEEVSWWVSMFRMVVEAVKDMWNGLVDMFASAIQKIQEAFASKDDAPGDSHSLETTMVITGLVVLVTTVFVFGTVLLL